MCCGKEKGWRPREFCCSVAQSCLTLCDPHGLQHTRLPCPSLSPGVCSDSPPLSQWCHPTISSSATPVSFCFQSFPALGSFLMSWLSASGGQSIGPSASASACQWIMGWVLFNVCVSVVVLGPEPAMMVGSFWTEIRRRESCGLLQEEHCGPWRHQRQRPKDGNALEWREEQQEGFS